MEQKQRASNFELLRILAMLTIIMFHIYKHCIYHQLTDLNSISVFNNGFFCEPIFYRRLYLLVFFSPLGKVGNFIFICISGYFMVEKGSNINLFSISKK